MPAIRPATREDLASIVELLSGDAQARARLDPVLWRVAADAPARIETAVGAALNAPQVAAREFWLVAGHAQRIAGVTHAAIVPVPPIYDSAASTPGLLHDDCVISADAPSGTAEALLAATEAALRSAGATTLIASCLAAGPLRSLYQHHGYEPVTLYMAKHRLGVAPAPGVRPAGAADVPVIVKRSADHRATLARINPRFWHIHPEADRRFDAWMRRSLTLADRDMFVAVEAGALHGYVIAQPASALLFPAGHDVAAIGVIDDFSHGDFANGSAVANVGMHGDNLLAAAEGAFARRHIDSALVVCPAAWPSKVSLLERRGYRTAKLWMLKG